jgi:hypothetical protein
MKKIIIITLISVAALLFFSNSWAIETATASVNYYYDLNRYVLIARYEPRLFIELRSFENDKIIDDMVISSRYGTPTFSFKDVILDDNEEMIITSAGGGTGLYVNQLMIVAIIDDKLVNVGEFNLRYEGGAFNYSEKTIGTVQFTKKNELIYSYKKNVDDDGKKSFEKKADRYIFNVDKNKFEKIKKKDGKTKAP